MGRYITITEWMLSLGIKGNELLVYAIIYGFSQDGSSCYRGSASYLSYWLGGVKRDTVYEVLKRLCEKGLITKEETTINGVRLCYYKATPENGVLPRKTGNPTPKNGDNNTIDINSNNNNINKREAGFSKPTTEEVRAYCEERQNGINPVHFCNYYEAKGWKVGRTQMKDWKAAIRTWEDRRKEEKAATSAPKEDNITVMMRQMGMIQ